MQKKVQQRIGGNIAYRFFHVFIEVTLKGLNGSGFSVAVKFNSHGERLKEEGLLVNVNAYREFQQGYLLYER